MHPDVSRPRPRVALAAAALLALVVSACSLPAPMLQEIEAGEESPQPGAAEFYDQQVTWESCGRDFECGSVTVPIDYDDPDGGTIEIQLKKYGLESAEGMVLINPGGPGGSGVETVEAAPHVFTTELRNNREIVGFDPRGVGGSAPISCYGDAQLDEWYSALYDLDSDTEWEDFLADMTDYVEACVENNPETIGHVDTVSAARDMDLIRAALGMELLDYLGFSYGTKLGATYADLFGANVGRFVLDGAMDLSLDLEELTRGQVGGFEGTYRAYLEDCLTGPDCPFAGTAEEAYEDTILVLEEVAARPVASGDPDRPVTEVDLMNAIIISLYATENWPLLSSAISGLERGEGEQVKFLSDFAIERDDDGHYAPADGASLAINCLDLPSRDIDRQEVLAEAEEFEEISPLFGPSFASTDIGCAAFPIKTEFGPQAVAAPNAPTMVVVGTTGDPATPYAWSEAMVNQLDDAVLLTWEGQEHTAYGKGSCLDEAIDDFLIEGILPEDGLRC